MTVGPTCSLEIWTPFLGKVGDVGLNPIEGSLVSHFFACCFISPLVTHPGGGFDGTFTLRGLTSELLTLSEECLNHEARRWIDFCILHSTVTE